MVSGSKTRGSITNSKSGGGAAGEKNAGVEGAVVGDSGGVVEMV